ncbi:integrase catalytic domain-containing protein [Trichonephila clavipes]|nr:integrase catalytic domain-containing protein [Trichonephila clavipes]
MEAVPLPNCKAKTASKAFYEHYAQMVYDSNIRLSGEIFNPPSIQIDPETFVTIFQTFMDELKPTKCSSPESQQIFVHKVLKYCTHVFVRVDRVRKALESPHNG